MSFGSFLDMHGEISLNELRENTEFLCNHFYDERIDITDEGGCTFYPDEIDALKKSIEIILCGKRKYSSRSFIKGILSDPAPGFWNDLYWLEYYEKAKKVVEDIIKRRQNEFDSDPDKDDVSFKADFNQAIHNTQEALTFINEVIELSKEFRSLIKGVFPDLEDKFARRLQEYKDLQVTEVAFDEEQEKQGEQRISNKTATISQDKAKEPPPQQPFFSDQQITNLFSHVGKILGDDLETWKQRFVDDYTLIDKPFPNIEEKATPESNKRLLVAMLGLIDDKNKELSTNQKFIKSKFDEYALKKWGLKSFRKCFKANYYNVLNGEKDPTTRHSKWINIKKVI